MFITYHEQGVCCRSPQESSDESGVPSKEDESEIGTAPCPPSPRKINENILKAQLVAIDRNSIGSYYDNVLHREDADSDGSVEETGLVDDCHDSDVEQSEVPVKEIRVVEGLAEEESVEYRARETLKNIPANLVCGFPMVSQLLKDEKNQQSRPT